jgi:hypothetical protein
MSQVDYKAALQRIVGEMQAAGFSRAEVIALIIGDTYRPASAPEPEKVRMVSIPGPNGTTRNVPWSAALQAQLDHEKQPDNELEKLIREQEADLAKMRAMRGKQ